MDNLINYGSIVPAVCTVQPTLCHECGESAPLLRDLWLLSQAPTSTLSEDYGVIAPYPAERIETDETFAVGVTATANVWIHEHCPPDRLLVLVETKTSGISEMKTHDIR